MREKQIFMIIKPAYRHAGALFLALGLIGEPDATAADYYVAQNGQTPGAYTSWVNAASNIQDAVNAANTNDTVWVGAGRYTVPTNAVDCVGTNVVYIDKPLILRSSNGVPATTIIDGGGACRGVNFWQTNVSTTNRPSVLEGFTISNCYATNMGGGVLFFADMAVWTGEVRNCVISDNAVAWGTNAGLYSSSGSRGGGIVGYGRWNTFGLTVSNCTIRNNQALAKGPNDAEFAYGGGIWSISFGTRRIVGSRIESNSATVGGGCYFNYGSSDSIIENCTVAGNRTVDSGYWNKMNVMKGGGIHHVNQGFLVCRNVLFYNNYSIGYGGAIFAQVPLSVYNCTIVSNQGNASVCGKGTGLMFDKLVACNTIIYSNAYPTYEIYTAYYTNAFFTNCCMTATNLVYLYPTETTNGAIGSGNFAANPMVINWAKQDYRLQAGSPCLNKGLNQGWMTGAVDRDGHARIDRFSGIVDIGCYEYLYRGVLFKLR